MGMTGMTGMTAKQLKEIREMLRNTTSSDGSILKRAGTSLSALCEYIEALEKVSEAAKAMRFDGPNAYGAMEVSSGKGTVTSLQAALSDLDAKENNTCSPTL